MDDSKLKALLDSTVLADKKVDRPSEDYSAQVRSLLFASPLAQPSALPAPVLNPEWAAPLSHLTGRILHELHENPKRLQNLDRSRRLAICEYLEQLSRLEDEPISGMGDRALDPTKENQELRKWTEGSISTIRSMALKTFFEEVAFSCLGQALLLRQWSLKEVLKLREGDLGRINWVLCNTLKNHIPIGRESFNLTRNLYSWYVPSESIQHEIWNLLETLKAPAPPSLIETLRQSVCISHRDLMENRGFDTRFISAVWKSSKLYGWNESNPEHFLNRKKWIFSPTLRDGTFIRGAPIAYDSAVWVGTEPHLLKLLAAELHLLWEKPTEPPLWTLGNGIDTLPREQMDWSSKSLKPSTLSRVTEVEACDFAYVVEERSSSTTRVKGEIEKISSLKNIRNKNTSLGEFQALVAIQKLRPGGILWWFREEPLHPHKSHAVLKHLIERGRLIAEWDLSALEHTLPSRARLFSKYVYLFERDSSLQARSTHQPAKVLASGSIRSHIELSHVLEEILAAPLRGSTQKTGWATRVLRPNLTQAEWLDSWPDAVLVENLKRVEKVQAESIALGEIASVRTAAFQEVEPRGCIWVWLGENGLQTSQTQPTQEALFQIWCADSAWLGVLRHWLEHPWLRLWLEVHAEKKNGKPYLSESRLKLLPIPKTLQRMVLQPSEITGPISLESLAFVKSAQEDWNLRESHRGILRAVRTDGKVEWTQLLAMIPKSSWVPASTSPYIETQGRLPSQQVITRIDRVKAPRDGFIFVCEGGVNAWMGASKSFLNEILGEQLAALKNPTWMEVVSTLRLPRSVEHAEEAAAEILKRHGTLQNQLAELAQKINSCKIL